jgi:hypothetical protein
MLGASTVYDELVLTYSFLFTRDASSKKIATELFAGHDMTVVFVSGTSHVDLPRWSVMITEWNLHFPKQQAPLLQHFERYRGHLASLLNEMAERKGQSPNFPPAPFQMRFRPYKDRFTLYVILFAVLIGVVSITSIMQTIVSFRAYGAGIGLLSEARRTQTNQTRST